jgi:hypothetical protein
MVFGVWPLTRMRVSESSISMSRLKRNIAAERKSALHHPHRPQSTPQQRTTPQWVEVGALEDHRAPKSTRVVLSQGSSAEDAAYIPWHPMELSSFRQQPVGCPRDTTLIELSTQLCSG